MRERCVHLQMRSSPTARTSPFPRSVQKPPFQPKHQNILHPADLPSPIKLQFNESTNNRTTSPLRHHQTGLPSEPPSSRVRVPTNPKPTRPTFPSPPPLGSGRAGKLVIVGKKVTPIRNRISSPPSLPTDAVYERIQPPPTLFRRSHQQPPSKPPTPTPENGIHPRHRRRRRSRRLPRTSPFPFPPTNPPPPIPKQPLNPRHRAAQASSPSGARAAASARWARPFTRAASSRA